jgi:predicted metal-dependent peptidase
LILASIDHLAANPRRTWAAARVWAAHQAPYLASALLALEPVVVDQSDDPVAQRVDLRALPIDRHWHVYLDADVLESSEVPTLGFWLIHQVSHLLRHHADRSPVSGGEPSTPLHHGSPDQGHWNLAADAEINDDLVAGAAKVPEAATTPKTLGLPDAWTAEQYFDALRVSTKQQPATGDEDAGEAAGDEDAGGGASDADAGSAADCGSGGDGISRLWDVDTPGLSDSGQRLVEHDVARRIEEHQRKYGDVPAGLRRWASEVLSPSVSWQRLLASAIRRGAADVAGRVDFTYRKPSRRSSAVSDVVLPSLRQPLPKVAMVLDTSGSMDEHLLARSLAEVEGVLQAVGIGRRHLHVVCCDAKAFEAQEVMQARDVELLGGGGTDMGAGLAKASELRPRPDLIVVLTDGHTPWPSEAPRGIHVIVGLMDPNGFVPTWARAIAVGMPGAA